MTDVRRAIDTTLKLRRIEVFGNSDQQRAAMKKSFTYRFAFYGRSGSGKTCLLSALAMSHRPNPEGYTCTRVPLEGCDDPLDADSNATAAREDLDPAAAPAELVDEAKDLGKAGATDRRPASHRPASTPAEATGDAKRLAQSQRPAPIAVGDVRESRRRGDAWIEEAVEALKRGDLPRANQASDFVMTFEYEFTSPDRRTYRIELVDYSGELLNPRDLSDSESIAAQLREHLVGMDGLLVVAEAPRAGETEHLSHELNLLRQAFVALRGEKQDGAALDTPVALLVSKWDRQSDLSENPQPDEELQKLDQFFESPEHGEYRQLRNDLQNGVTRGNFRAFPVSALGPVQMIARQDGSVVERPSTQAPLPSFGMEDGFVWAARRCDALLLREYEEKALGLSWFWPPWRAGSGSLARNAAQLARRLPQGTGERARAQRVARDCRAKQLSRGMLATAVLLMFWLTSECLWDRGALREAKSALADPTTKPETIARYEQWLDDYADSGPHQHVLSKWFFPREDAYQQVHELRKARVEADWSRVAAVKDVYNRAQAARKHRLAYENSPHLNEVIESIEAAENQRADEENKAWWQLLSEDSRRALADRSEADLNALLKRIDAPPHSERENEGEHERRMELRIQVSKVLSQLAAEKEWSQFLAEFNGHVDAGRHLDAGALLAERVQERKLDERLEQACERFRDRLDDEFPSTIRELIRLNKWTDARDLVRRLEREQDLWPTAMHPTDGEEFVEMQRKHVGRAYDQHLYDVLRRNRTTSAAQDYLDVAPLGTMRREAESFKQWLGSRGNALKLTLVLTRIEWGRNAQHANDNHVTIRVNEETVGERLNVVSKANSSTGELLRYAFRAKLDEDLKLTVRIIERDFFGFHDDHGRGEQTVRVYDLARGFKLPLRSDNYSHTAVFHLKGAPPEPDLPEWRDD